MTTTNDNDHRSINIDTNHPIIKGRITLSRAEVAEVLGISETLCFKLMKHGDLPYISAGRRKLVPVAGLLEWLKTGNSLNTKTKD